MFSTEEAQALAKSVAAQLGNAYVEAEGSCKGDPRLRAGTKVKIDGIGTRFGGTYTLSSTTHVYRGAHGLPDALLDLGPLAAQPRRPDDARGASAAGATRS